MTPATYNIAAHTSGDTWRGLTATIQVNGEVPEYPLSSVRMQVKKRTNSQHSIEFSTSDGSIVINGDPANWNFSVLPIVVNISPYVYLYDIQTTDTEGNIYTYIKGTWEILADVTN